MILYLIRHAQSANNVLAEKVRAIGELDELSYDDYRLYRVADPSLTDIGFRQAEILADYLQTAKPKHRAGFDDPGDLEPGEFEGNPFAINRLYCSAMLRALQTASPIAEKLGLRPRIWLDVHEHGGVFDNRGEDGLAAGKPGLTRSEVADLFPGAEIPDTLTDNGWWLGDEEDYASCQGRAIRVAQDLVRMARDNENDRVAIVSHGTFLDCLLKALIGRLPGYEFRFGHYNTSITRVDFTHSAYDGAPQAILRYVNRVDHLSQDLIT
ncbi:MAG: histidine phosphatase family protein [Caldilineaceae bacterium]